MYLTTSTTYRKTAMSSLFAKASKQADVACARAASRVAPDALGVTQMEATL